MSKVTKKQLHNGWHCHDTEIIKIKRELRELKQSVLRLEKLTDEKLLDEPQLKQLDQSIFNGLDEKWRFAAVDADGSTYAYVDKPRCRLSTERWVNNSENEDCLYLSGIHDTSNWQKSLIERDTTKELPEVDSSSELTGSELVRAMLERGDRCVMCMVANNEANMFLATRPVVVHGCTDSGFISVSGCYSFAVAVNNQGEPLTAADVGL